MSGDVPVPLSVTALGLPDALCVMDSTALFPPELDGVNVTLIVQLAFGVSDAEQVFVWANCAASAPVIETPLTARLAVPVLVSVTD